MRFVWTVLAFVLAALLIGAGIAQRTLFVGPTSQEQAVAVEQPAPFVLVDSSVLRTGHAAQELTVSGDGDLFAAYARTADVKAWLAGTTYNSVTVGSDGEPETTHVVPADGAEPTTRNPAGSDLWLNSFVEQDELTSDTPLPEGTSILLARDGMQDAPENIVVSWPLDTSTPWAGPLVAMGIVALLAGIVLYILGIRHQHRGRGPRRKGPGPLPPTEPLDLALEKPEDLEAIEAPARVRATSASPAVAPESTSQDRPDQPQRTQRVAVRRRRFILPVLAVSATLAVTGCTADSWPQFGATSPTPSPSSSAIAPENQKPPAVTESQAERILQSIADTVAKADTDRNADLAATRLDGVVLASRRTDYALRGTLTDRAMPAVIPTDEIEILLPEANDGWPRTVLLLSKDAGDDTVPPVILTMTQADPWSSYKVTDMAEMQPSVQVPDVAPAWLGTTLVPPTSTFLSVQPGELATVFADVVNQGKSSAFSSTFDDTARGIVKSLQEERQRIVQELRDAGAEETSKTEFSIAPSSSAPVSIATLDSGAIVAVSLVETQTITPTVSEAAIKFGDVPDVKALTGVEESSKGVTTTFSVQLFFAVPTQGSTEQIALLAAHQNILGAEVIK